MAYAWSVWWDNHLTICGRCQVPFVKGRKWWRGRKIWTVPASCRKKIMLSVYLENWKKVQAIPYQVQRSSHSRIPICPGTPMRALFLTGWLVIAGSAMRFSSSTKAWAAKMEPLHFWENLKSRRCLVMNQILLSHPRILVQSDWHPLIIWTWVDTQIKGKILRPSLIEEQSWGLHR